MDFTLVDKVYRSRKTILDILDSRGYDTTPYRKFSPVEIERMVGKETSLMMDLKKRDNEDKMVRVIYFLDRLKQRIPKLISKLLGEESDKEKDKLFEIDPANTEVIVLTNDEIGEVFNNESIKAYNKHYGESLIISFFEILHLSALNPLTHVRVPRHERVPLEEHDVLLKSLYTVKSHLPVIRYHEDPIARCIGLVPGDIVKITRPSPMSGEYILYRVCMP